jgi:hypothetical protein
VVTVRKSRGPEAKEKYRREFFEAFERARGLNPHVAAIGSSDFHSSAPLGDARTYLFVRERSVNGVLDAIRRDAPSAPTIAASSSAIRRSSNASGRTCRPEEPTGIRNGDGSRSF